jgi:hypothetical protein
MSVEAIQAAVGDDGIKTAVAALKDIADNRNEHAGDRVVAAQTLLSYGFAHFDALGNPQLG